MKNLRMRTKLSLGFGIVLSFTFLLGAVSLEQFNNINTQTSFTATALIPQTTLTIGLDESMREVGLLMQGFKATGDKGQWDKSVTIMKEFVDSLEELRNLVSKVDDLPLGQQFLLDIREPLQRYNEAAANMKRAREALEASIATMLVQGPLASQAVRTVSVHLLENLGKGLEEGEKSRMERDLRYLEHMGSLVDIIANLRRDIFVALATHDAALMNAVMNKMREPQAEVERLAAGLRHNAIMAAHLGQTGQMLQKFQQAAENTQTALNHIQIAEQQLDAAFAKVLELVAKVTHSTQDRSADIVQKLDANASTAINYSILLLALVSVVGLGMTLWLTKSVTTPLIHCAAVARDLGQGNFDARMNLASRDEIGLTAENINKAFDVVVEKMRWYESMLDAIPSLISVTDNDRRWTFVNRAAEVALGRKRMELLGQRSQEWIAKGSHTTEHGQKESTFKMNGVHYSLLPSHILDGQGKTIGTIELCTDITELEKTRQQAENALAQGMHTAASKIETVTGIIDKAAQELALKVSEAENGSTEQAARMHETATAMEEMNSTVNEVARNAADAAQVTAATKRKAEEGAQVVGSVVTGIEQVRADALLLKDDMTALSEQAQAITRIMSVISDIADQTNLLALNAAIEAARAGDAGRGFAVVADEVRKLAEKTMLSTVDVSQAIRAIQASSEKSARQVDAAALSIEDATNKAQQSGVALQEIVHMVENAADQVRAIATASEQQSASSEEINRSVLQVNAIAADTAKAMEEAARSVSTLSTQSTTLAMLVNQMQKA